MATFTKAQMRRAINAAMDEGLTVYGVDAARGVVLTTPITGLSSSRLVDVEEVNPWDEDMERAATEAVFRARALSPIAKTAKGSSGEAKPDPLKGPTRTPRKPIVPLVGDQGDQLRALAEKVEATSNLTKGMAYAVVWLGCEGDPDMFHPNKAHGGSIEAVINRGYAVRDGFYVWLSAAGEDLIRPHL